MLYWSDYNGHIPDIIRSRKLIDNTIYTFDIESTSYIILNNNQYNAIDYLYFSEKEQKNCKPQGLMYIWMFGIRDTVYYGRTWQELSLFLERLNKYSNKQKTVFVHNLSWEFEFLENILNFDNVFARKSRHVIKFDVPKYKLTFRCTYMMSNCSLEKLSDVYGLKTKKLVGSLDYSKIRHNKTPLTKQELSYCENDCLVLYEFIKQELEEYSKVGKIPLTSTGHVRKEFKEIIEKNWKYKNKVRRSINTEGNIYSLLLDAFSGRLYSF